MTSTTFKPAERHSPIRTFAESGVYGDELGPFATFVGQLVVFSSMFVAFPPFDGIPGKSSLLMLTVSIGVLLLAPRNAVKRIPISVSITAFVGIMLLSVLWTNNLDGTIFSLERVVPQVLTFSIIVGLLRFEDFMVGLIWSFRVALLITIVASAIDPTTRLHISEEQYGDAPLPGWHGWYFHKNFMAPLFCLGALTVAMFDRNRVAKWLTLTGFTVMIVMSDSKTGIFAFIMMLGIWWWLEHFSQLDERNGVMFFVSTSALGLLGVAGAFTSLNALTTVAGRDANFSGRTAIWTAGIDAFLERPLLGFGLNGLFWSNPVKIETIELWRSVGFDAQHAHQGFLDVLLQLGIVGFVVYMALFSSTLSSGWKMIKTNRKIGMWIVAVMIGQLFMALSENTLTGSWLMVLVMFRLLTVRRYGMDFPERGSKRPVPWVPR